MPGPDAKIAPDRYRGGYRRRGQRGWRASGL